MIGLGFHWSMYILPVPNSKSCAILVTNMNLVLHKGNPTFDPQHIAHCTSLSTPPSKFVSNGHHYSFLSYVEDIISLKLGQSTLILLHDMLANLANMNPVKEYMGSRYMY